MAESSIGTDRTIDGNMLFLGILAVFFVISTTVFKSESDDFITRVMALETNVEKTADVFFHEICVALGEDWRERDFVKSDGEFFNRHIIGNQIIA